MKNTSFERLWTKTSLKRIRKEFVDKKGSLLCHSSSEFKTLWHSTHRNKIIELAQKFDRSLACEIDHEGALFYTDWDTDHSVRLAFLDHEINRLFKK